MQQAVGQSRYIQEGHEKTHRQQLAVWLYFEGRCYPAFHARSSFARMPGNTNLGRLPAWEQMGRRGNFHYRQSGTLHRVGNCLYFRVRRYLIHRKASPSENLFIPPLGYVTVDRAC